MAQTLSDNLDSVERIERLAALAEARRSATLREFDRHRAMLDQAQRRIVEQIPEAECEVVDAVSTERAVLLRPRAGSNK